MYLIHLPVLQLWQKILDPYLQGDRMIRLFAILGCWPFCLFLAYLSYHWIEKPSIAIGKKVLGLN
jgi:peptidoglycan/LPS O-acetylase OafA/YrhL